MITYDLRLPSMLLICFLFQAIPYMAFFISSPSMTSALHELSAASSRMLQTRSTQQSL